MSRYIDKTLTESYRDKNYEVELTRLYFKATKDLKYAHSLPSLEYIRTAYSAVREFSEATIYSPNHLLRYKSKIVPVMDSIQLILFGDPKNMEAVTASIDYNSRLIKRRGKFEIENGVNLLNELSQILFLVKQWAYEQGLLLSKPVDRKYGKSAVEDNMQM